MVSFCVVCFFWFAFFFVKSGLQNWLQGFQAEFWQVWFGLFCQVHSLWQSKLFAKSVFSKAFGKSTALVFSQFNLNFQSKVGLVKNCRACKIKSVKGWVLVFRRRVLHKSGTLTKRAADFRESAASRSIFLASGFFYIANRIHARPHAGNANRCQVRIKLLLLSQHQSHVKNGD